MDARGYIEANSGEYFAALKQWFTIRSVSAGPETAAYLWDQLGAPAPEITAGRAGSG